MKKHIYPRLVGFELRKAFLEPWILIFLVALLLVNGWKMLDTYHKKVAEWEPHQEVYNIFYEKYTGSITPEKISDLMAVYGPLKAKADSMSLSLQYDPEAYTYSELLDERFFNTLFYTEMQYDYLYQNEAHQIVRQAGTLAKLADAVGNSYEAEKNRAIMEDFTGRSIPRFGDTRPSEVLLNYDYSAMLVLLMCLFGLCGVFVTERESEMTLLLRTTCHGGMVTAAAKLTASLIFTVTVCALFFGEDFLVVQLASGRRDALSSPVYAIRYLETTPLTMTVGRFFLWAGMVKTLGVLCCGCLILLVSCLAKRVLSAFAVSLSLLMSCVLLQEICRSRTWLKWFNPMELVIVREIVAEDRFVNIFGHAVRLYEFVLCGILLTMLCLCLGILCRSRSRRGGRVC